ncbi:M81 family peptidase [Mesorhizobium sp. M3A.F.Ca.ET.080.04.2.1]|uniref:M81 family metallopeptidase n=1 Tax=Mesorhizobium sp. M3A.F.Ca.ET.080.04.2.1 TaxID=2493676 RepID=UPI000F753B4F|nr:M81 family metallopeptidase [Mesorhizobium sp. M3A.F.Ca.ET.080.04.2.1]AZO07790.1 M81 family peptidase [Mesorhizobium sp. M3A.F.Ca.ET.080.04.2.1]RWF16571.1 MAG: M81 family peptidase [Mesorhizobium sp.]
MTVWDEAWARLAPRANKGRNLVHGAMPSGGAKHRRRLDERPSSRRRILVGRLFHESHSFSPQITFSEAFEVKRGEHVLAHARHSGTTLGGIVKRATELGYLLVPTVSAVAPPGGLVDHDFYVQLRDALIALARQERYDAIALELHGAMATTELPDADGDLLVRLREAVGPDVPIGIGLDLHAHVTGAMLSSVDICIACKENPHSDVILCGERVVECLAAVLDGTLDPVLTMAKVPMILPGAAETGSGPLAELHARARVLVAAHTEIWDVSLFNVYPYADDQGMGQAVVVLTHGLSRLAQTAAIELAEFFWACREHFQDGLLTIDQAFELIAREPDRRPYILADMGDRVLAGAPGDSTAIIETALARADRPRGAVPVTDPESVQAAAMAGIGAQVTLAIGGGLTPGFVPHTVSGVVAAISDGRFVIGGPFGAGEETSLGRTAVLVVDDRLRIMLTSKPGFTHDPAAFASQGIDVASQDFVVVKSGYHFKLNFAGIGAPLGVATPGIGYYTPGLLQWRRARFWPEHEVHQPEIRAYVNAKSAKTPAD